MYLTLKTFRRHGVAAALILALGVSGSSAHAGIFDSLPSVSPPRVRAPKTSVSVPAVKIKPPPPVRVGTPKILKSPPINSLGRIAPRVSQSFKTPPSIGMGNIKPVRPGGMNMNGINKSLGNVSTGGAPFVNPNNYPPNFGPGGARPQFDPRMQHPSMNVGNPFRQVPRMGMPVWGDNRMGPPNFHTPEFQNPNSGRKPYEIIQVPPPVLPNDPIHLARAREMAEMTARQMVQPRAHNGLPRISQRDVVRESTQGAKFAAGIASAIGAGASAPPDEPGAPNSGQNNSGDFGPAGIGVGPNPKPEDDGQTDDDSAEVPAEVAGAFVTDESQVINDPSKANAYLDPQFYAGFDSKGSLDSPSSNDSSELSPNLDPLSVDALESTGSLDSQFEPAGESKPPAAQSESEQVVKFVFVNSTDEDVTYSIRTSNSQWGTYTLKPGKDHQYSVSAGSMTVKLGSDADAREVDVTGNQTYAFADQGAGTELCVVTEEEAVAK